MVGGSAVLTRAHVVIVDDSLDRWKWALVAALLVVAVLLIIANMVKWRRGKHRADPQLKAVVDAKVEQIAAASSIPGRVCATEDEIAEMKAEWAKYRKAFLAAFAEAGMKPPADLLEEYPPPLLRLINGGKGA